MPGNFCFRVERNPDSRAIVERCEHDAVDALTEEVLDDFDLLVPIVLFHRSFPDDVDALLVPRLHRTGMDRLPELVRGALGNDGEAFLRRSGRRAGLCL